MTTRPGTDGGRTQNGASRFRPGPAFALLFALAALSPACSKKSDNAPPPPPGPGLVIVESGGNTAVSEAGGTDTYTVALRTCPSSDVTVTVTPNAQLTATPLSLTFTAADWNVARTVTVGAVNDGDAEGNHTGTIAHAASSADADYNGMTASVTAGILDNDTVGMVSGTVRYTNKVYNRTSGFTGAVEMKPVRQAEVEVVQSPGTVIGSGVTDDTGAYSITVTNVGTVNCFLRVYARRRDATSGVAGPVEAVVMNNDTSQAIYTAASSAAGLNTSIPQTVNLDIALGASSAFNIFDTAVYTHQFLHALDATIVDPPLVVLYWETGTSDGTYFQPGTDPDPDSIHHYDSIHLLGQATDSDDFDDDIILHELGHYVLSNYSRDNSPGGSHSLTGHYDICLTWSEGWAHFWSAAVRKWAGYAEYVWQVDTYGASSHGAWRLDTPSYASTSIGADNEGSVAAILWDIATGAADGGSLDLGNDEIWNVVHDRFQSRYVPLTNERFATLEDFYDEWVAVPYASLASILSGRTVRYELDVDDASASNDTGATAVALGALPATRTLRTFFKTGASPIGDEDWFSFSATAGTTYRIATSDLGDGADTYIRVYSDAAGTNQVAENDDWDWPTDISSRVDFTPSSSGMLYIKVAPYPGIPPYPDAGQVATYGSYTLSVTVP